MLFTQTFVAVILAAISAVQGLPQVQNPSAQTQTPTPTGTVTPSPTQAPTQVPTQMSTEAPTQVPTQMSTEVPTQVSTQVPIPSGAVCAAGQQIYTVMAGDTCFTIAQQFPGTTAQSIIDANSGVINSGCTNLQPNQVICVPVGTVPTQSSAGSSGTSAGSSTGSSAGSTPSGQTTPASSGTSTGI